MKQSEILTKFYRAYFNWVSHGAQECEQIIFVRKHGLCKNLLLFCAALGMGQFIADDAGVELRDQFTNAGLDRFVPFNVSGEYRLDSSKDDGKGVHHLNEARMNWVKDHTGEQA